MNKKIVGFVPVKLNNERLPGKNTKALGDKKPLISFVLQTLKKAKGLDSLYVYCSDERIKEYLPMGVKMLKRDKSLDSSETLILEVLQAFARDVNADIYVLAHATAPFIKTETIEEAIESVKEKGYDSAMTVTKLNELLWHKEKPMYDNRRIPRTQDLEDTYAETTGLYVYTKDLILNQGRRVGDNPNMVNVDRVEAVDINEPIDFDIAQMLYEKYIRNGDAL